MPCLIGACVLGVAMAGDACELAHHGRGGAQRQLDRKIGEFRQKTRDRLERPDIGQIAERDQQCRAPLGLAQSIGQRVRGHVPQADAKR